MANKYLSRWTVLTTIFLFLMTFVTVNGATAASKEIIMKVGYPMGATPDHPNYHAGQHLKARIEDLTEGNVKVRLYPQSQLGGDRDMTEGVMNGTIEMAWPDSAVMVLAVPEIGVLNLPFLFKDIDHAFRVLDGKVGKILETKCLAKGIRIGSWNLSGVRHIMTVKKPINKFEDMKGLKIRVMETPIFIEMVKAWNATPTPVSWPEVYMALKQGVVEGQETGVDAALDMKHFEVIRYVALTYDSIAFRPFLISEKWFQSLPPNIREGVSKATKEAGKLLTQKNRDFFDKSIEIAKDKWKVTFTNPDIRPFREAVMAVYPKFEKIIGGRELIDLALAVE